ncbi:glycoside hydrolase family 76 protein [Flavivirga sp. 57AJ16]|nr:glycoside hydrolase family 76 protein [Flavivirga sp. 57AJ16]
MIAKCMLIFFCSTLLKCSEAKDNEIILPTDDGVVVPDDPNNLSYKEKAKAVYDLIQQQYKAGDLYRENSPSGAGDNKYCYLWPYVGMLTAANVLYDLGYDKSILTKEFGGVEAFYDNRPVLPSYQAYPIAETASDHYYDDAAIVAMEFIDAYRLTNEQAYLDRAIKLVDFIMSGEDNRLGGGLYWLEAVSKDCTNEANCIKAANTTAYASFVASELYKETNMIGYLDFAKRTYQWNYNNLRDTDNLYWNDKSIATGQVNPVKWTYNAAMMIMSGVNLYEITNDSSYLDQAIATARSAYSKFTRVVNDKIFYPANDSWFNVELMTSFIELSEHDQKSKDYVETFIDNIDYAWENARTSDGRFYEDWSGQNEGRSKWLLQQAALIEAYGRAAKFKE